MSRPSVAELRPIDLFDGVDDEHLAEFAAHAELRDFSAGEQIAQEGGSERRVYLLLDGTAETFREINGGQESSGDHAAPTYLGAIGALTGSGLAVQVQAKTDVHLAQIDADEFLELAIENRSVLRLVLARVRPVVGRITAIEQNRERLESLGTMAAGLAHELNNPAAAAKRASADLADALDVLSSTIGVFVESGVSREQAEQLVEIQRAVVQACRARASISQLELADAEDELTDALERAGIADAYRIVEPLAQAGFDEQQLARVGELAGPATEAAVRWIAASLLARELAAELSESTERMSKLVAAVKTYAYMDRGGLVEVDIREGLDTTLTILGHKLKHTTIEVEREFEQDLPRFQAYGAELNQVWTNLLDNAIDALGDSGTITISAQRDGDCVEVDIADDGPGVPAEVQERIFDPFFTTKEVGKGTGLGLDTARRIVADRHHGSLSLRSEPGRTVFRVRLPVAQPEATERSAAPGAGDQAAA
ncbi:MAG TPA: ATP-binding protein [Solirubrobacteraceae bacterium]|jgi:signal transduction histidine kinase|nr:ATP-binding protein [Solirubrobacteraceae bacterium]